MFCEICVQLINDEAKDTFRTKYPEVDILSSSISKPQGSIMVLLEISVKGRHRLEYEGVEGILNFCINCGGVLGGN
jgi:hypothetical protein